MKRYIREGFRRHRTALPAGTDVVVIARLRAASLGAAEVEQELRGLLESLQ
jgi:ribonuclease P protein component